MKKLFRDFEKRIQLDILQQGLVQNVSEMLRPWKKIDVYEAR